jgi:hypothetical protein
LVGAQEVAVRSESVQPDGEVEGAAVVQQQTAGLAAAEGAGKHANLGEEGRAEEY